MKFTHLTTCKGCVLPHANSVLNSCKTWIQRSIEFSAALNYLLDNEITDNTDKPKVCRKIVVQAAKLKAQCYVLIPKDKI